MTKWYWYTRGTIHPHRVDQVFLGVKYFAAELNVTRFYKTLYINIGDKLYWGWDEKEIRMVGKKIFSICASRSGQKKHIDKIKFYINQALKAAAYVRNLDLTSKTNQELIDLYDYLLIKAAPAHGFLDVDVDAVDVVSEEFLQKQIKQVLPKTFSQSDFLELYQKIATPLYESYLSQEERAIITNATSNYSEEGVQKLYSEYWWTTLGWESMKIRTENYYTKVLKSFKNKSKAKFELSTLNSRLTNIKKERASLLKKYHLGSGVKYWLDFFDVYTYLHDFRKEMQMKTTYSFYLLLKEVARRFKLNINDLEWLYYEDIKRLLRTGKFGKQEIKLRKKAVYVLVNKTGIKRFGGKKAIVLAKKVLNQDITKTRYIKGTPVSPGKLIAKVKVCNGSEEALRKVKRGDILVTGMTLPNYVPAMKKAGAIITNEGGLTCHAAIIARELGKPCIVGLKIATKLLKDGDLVEVDAYKGIVTIIKN